MDIQQAKDFISGTVTNKQKEIDAYNVALSILQNTFVAEFTARDAALSEAKGLADQNKQLLIDKDELQKQLTATSTPLETPPVETLPVEKVI